MRTGGLIVSETAGSVTVRQPLGVEVSVARTQIAKMQASKLSLMPEGLEEGLTSRDLADLTVWISSLPTFTEGKPGFAAAWLGITLLPQQLSHLTKDFILGGSV